MILKTELLKDSCDRTLQAISKSKLDDLRDCLELITEGNILHLNITNNEYYVSVTLSLDHEETFHSVVNATQFLKLVSQINNESIELGIKDANMVVKSGSSRYKLPMMFNDRDLIELKKIDIYNVTVNTEISSDYLHSILNINSKDVAKRSFGSPVQQMYYLDENGCITFASGACINNFSTHSAPFRILLTDTLVKLFKLFDKGVNVKMQLGYDMQEATIQPKLKLSYNNIEITSLLNNDDSLISSVPVSTIRRKADRIQSDSSGIDLNDVVVNKTNLTGALNRLEIFNTNRIVKLTPAVTGLTVSDLTDNNTESLDILENAHITINDRIYLVDADKLKILLNNCEEQSLKIYFTDDFLLIRRNNVINIIPTYEQE